MQDIWDWVVYPADQTRPMVATGTHDDEGRARASVEQVMRTVPEAAWGITMHQGKHWGCARRRGGGYAWREVKPWL